MNLDSPNNPLRGYQQASLMSMYKESESQTLWQSLYHDFIFDLYDFCKELCDYLTEFDFKDFEGLDE